MPLKRHHKIMIGSFSSLLIILLIMNSVFIYILYGQLQLSYNSLKVDIHGLKEDTQSKFNELTENLIKTRLEVNNLSISINSLSSHVGSIDEEFDQLKASTSADFSGVLEGAVKAVVTIKTDVSQGTGFLISKEGYVITNAHVLSGARIVRAVDYNQNVFPAQLVGYNANLDIALLKINGKHEKLQLADSSDVQIGEKVIAIGNPLGLQFSVSEGIVSAIHRKGMNGLNAYIQTDAALNPGNSGGPLIDKQGKVIGINNFKIGSGENLGFALESNYIKKAVNEIAQQILNQTLI